ncbi:MAG: cytochrome c oxidase assembly protein [Candidatus Eremiobacteraeota bacterium]|nr:cytochrome c oxidase assembly protein [Candidatus Eremiobacteraeota bacterium]
MNLDRLADTSFAWHMAEHLIPLFLLPQLILLVRPFALIQRIVGKNSAATLVRMTRPLHAIANPVFALCFFVATMWATHFTGFYEYALEHDWAHALEHVLYLIAGIIFWLPIMGPPPLRPLPYPLRLFYLAIALPQGALLAVAINSARSPLYAHYAHQSVSAALTDQHNAAAVMWIGGGLLTFAAFLITLAAWASHESENEILSS